MSAVLGTYATKAASPTGDAISPSGVLGGRVQAMYDTYEASSLAAASTITVGGVLPTGAVILDIILWNDALGGSVTLDVGDSDTAARYASALDGNTAGRKNGDVIGGVGYVVGTNSGDNQILITTAGASATGTIHIIVLYAHAG